MEAATGTAEEAERSESRSLKELAGQNPAAVTLGIVLALALVLVLTEGLHDTAQTSLNGLSYGTVYALGAVGLTLVYGILKLVNFAHGDFLTFGAYAAFVINVTWGLPFVVGVLAAVVTTALLGLALERLMWRPMRKTGAGLLQLLLMSIGLALVIRNVIQMLAGSELKSLDVDVFSTVNFLGLRIGETELIVVVVGIVVLVAVGLMLRFTTLGKQMRALSDNLDLAETSGIDTGRVITYTWLLAGGLAGLAGALIAGITSVKPELGFELLLPIFAVVVLGGIGNAFGALSAGIILGLVIEWSTLIIDARWKLAIGFVILIVVLVIRPQGIFGKARSV
ncbi:branched-chain amino acid ABC transporter permease [soil metagenome]